MTKQKSRSAEVVSGSLVPRARRDHAAKVAKLDEPTDGVVPFEGPALTEQVVMIVDVRDPEPQGSAAGIADHVERVEAAVRDAHAVVSAHGGRTIALLGSRLVAAFSGLSVGSGLDAAVALQRRSADPAVGDPAWACVIALATGHVIDHASSATLGIPLVGGAVDRALLLCSWSELGAIVADDRTIGAAVRASSPDGQQHGPIPARQARMADVAGAAVARSWSLGVSRVLVGRDSEPVEYWELSFDQRPVSATTNSVDRAPRFSHAANGSAGNGPTAPMAATGVETSPEDGSGRRSKPDIRMSRAWSRGRVLCWFVDRRRGVIASSTDKEFYVDRRLLAAATSLREGTKVYFVPRDPVGEGRNPAAGVVVAEGARVEVRVDHIERNGYGWSELQDGSDTRARLPLDLSSSTAAGVGPGDWVLVEVRAGDHGPVGHLV